MEQHCSSLEAIQSSNVNCRLAVFRKEIAFRQRGNRSRIHVRGGKSHYYPV